MGKKVTPEQENAHLRQTIEMLTGLLQMTAKQNNVTLTIYPDNRLPPGSMPIPAVSVGEANYQVQKAYHTGYERGTLDTVADFENYYIPLWKAMHAINRVCAIIIGGAISVQPFPPETSRQLAQELGDLIIEADQTYRRVQAYEEKLAQAAHEVFTNVPTGAPRSQVDLTPTRALYNAVSDYGAGRADYTVIQDTAARYKSDLHEALEFRLNYLPGRKPDPVASCIVRLADEIRGEHNPKWRDTTKRMLIMLQNKRTALTLDYPEDEVLTILENESLKSAADYVYRIYYRHKKLNRATRAVNGKTLRNDSQDSQGDFDGMLLDEGR